MAANGNEFAWKVHDAINEWTGKVDSKASIVLAVEVAVVGFVVSLSTYHGPLSHLSRAHLVVYKFGIAILLVSTLFAAAAVFPQLSRRRSRTPAGDVPPGLIYFGHLRHWPPEQLKDRLNDLSDGDIGEALSVQLVSMSQIAWTKHTFLQTSMLLAVVSACLLFATRI